MAWELCFGELEDAVDETFLDRAEQAAWYVVEFWVQMALAFVGGWTVPLLRAAVALGCCWVEPSLRARVALGSCFGSSSTRNQTSLFCPHC